MQTTLHERIHNVIEVDVLFQIIIHSQLHVFQLLEKLIQLNCFECDIFGNAVFDMNGLSEESFLGQILSVHSLFLTVVLLDDFITNLTI